MYIRNDVHCFVSKDAARMREREGNEKENNAANTTYYPLKTRCGIVFRECLQGHQSDSNDSQTQCLQHPAVTFGVIGVGQIYILQEYSYDFKLQSERTRTPEQRFGQVALSPPYRRFPPSPTNAGWNNESLVNGHDRLGSLGGIKYSI